MAEGQSEDWNINKIEHGPWCARGTETGIWVYADTRDKLEVFLDRLK